MFFKRIRHFARALPAAGVVNRDPRKSVKKKSQNKEDEVNASWGGPGNLCERMPGVARITATEELP